MHSSKISKYLCGAICEKSHYLLTFNLLVCMKKIFTLFMATVVAMSMMAVPQVKK